MGEDAELLSTGSIHGSLAAVRPHEGKEGSWRVKADAGAGHLGTAAQPH